MPNRTRGTAGATALTTSLLATTTGPWTTAVRSEAPRRGSG
ncbi:hypothetical protein FHR75_001815 [Kineococcus radiotolerans]|uniref:Uncharacterized protein n=1 Tax=Kineococcus radiotolerans TaxID=131568 RepID=A0A7W4TLB5_KINRA|nr:hypothetical protein [Kineococcus radiotolerans]